MVLRSVSILATLVLMAIAAALVFRRAPFGDGAGRRYFLQLLGLALMIWARLTFGLRSFRFAANPTQGGLVTKGPYRYIRNPIYAAAWLIITGIARKNRPYFVTLKVADHVPRP